MHVRTGNGLSQNVYGSSGLCLEEVSLFICLNGEQPSSSHILFRFDLLHVIEIKKSNYSHGIVIKLQTSCCSPFSVVTEQNDLAAAAYLCVSGVTVQCPSSVRALRSV